VSDRLDVVRELAPPFSPEQSPRSFPTCFGAGLIQCRTVAFEDEKPLAASNATDQDANG
jgi:hypothetical protein